MPSMRNITLEVLTAPGCVHCREFLDYWKTEARGWSNVTMKEISLLTGEGQELIRRHKIFASPGILLNGELFGTGEINTREFLAKLRTLSGVE